VPFGEDLQVSLGGPN